MEGTIRTHDMELRNRILERMHEILGGITQSAGASYEMEVIQYAPPLVNERGLAGRVRPILARVVGEANVINEPPEMGAEDFAHFAQEVPGFYYNLGTTAPGTTSGGVHTPNFRGDDSAIPVGMRVMTNLVLEYLNGGMEPSE
jgi:amidohydrolase